MKVGDEILTLRTGDAVTVPGSVSHSFRIVSDEARFLTIMA
jgi:mannose-6-phosphate isomerase-like protein (cupin superfamily)